MREPVEGRLTVSGVVPVDAGEGRLSLRIAGVVSGPGVPATAVRTTRDVLRHETPPAAGDEFPATIDRAAPSVFDVHWPARLDPTTAVLAQKLHAEQAARAMRLGLDPSIVRPGRAPSGIREVLRIAQQERAAAHPLVDGSAPVTVAEAAELYRTGRTATATITGIDFLPVAARLLPDPEATIADVALQVHPADADSYPALGRFGFKTAKLRQAIGFAGAEVPVRFDASDPTRVTLDIPALAASPG